VQSFYSEVDTNGGAGNASISVTGAYSATAATCAGYTTTIQVF
jgi:hypothetical protein